MAKKENRVSITKLDEFLKSQDRGVVHVALEFGEGKKLEFDVKSRLDVSEFHIAVDGVVASSFVPADEIGTESYDAVQASAAMAVYILTTVANFKPETATDKLVALYEIQDVRDAIASIWGDQYKDFVVAVAEQTEWRQREILATERVLLQSVSTKLETATAALVNITDAFHDVDAATMSDLVEKLSAMDEMKLAQGVLGAQPEEVPVKQ